jgi:stage II sporulation protein D
MTSPVGSLFWSSRLIREELSVQPGKQGCLVVNALDLEKYLDGVVNGEFSARWNAEAVSAQVIAARTYALYQMREARAKRALYDVDSTTRDQVYLGTAGEEARASQLVQKTRGWVLVAGAGASVAPIKAFYHSTCGGITESPESVWGKSQPGVSGAVLCQFCGTSPRLVWELSMSRAQVDEALMPLGLGPVSVIEVALRFPSGRARRVRLGFEKERGKRVFKDLPASQLRMLLGPERFQSTAFEVERTASSDWIFRGRGYGHGVGMCQWGAKEMGAAGYSAREILSRYYPQARLERAW